MKKYLWRLFLVVPCIVYTSFHLFLMFLYGVDEHSDFINFCIEKAELK